MGLPHAFFFTIFLFGFFLTVSRVVFLVKDFHFSFLVIWRLVLCALPIPPRWDPPWPSKFSSLVLPLCVSLTPFGNAFS